MLDPDQNCPMSIEACYRYRMEVMIFYKKKTFDIKKKLFRAHLSAGYPITFQGAGGTTLFEREHCWLTKWIITSQ